MKTEDVKEVLLSRGNGRLLKIIGWFPTDTARNMWGVRIQKARLKDGTLVSECGLLEQVEKQLFKE